MLPLSRILSRARSLLRNVFSRSRIAHDLDWTAQDVRYAARTLIRRPGFTVVAVIALALGIGTTTAIFSVVNGVLLRPLPYREPDRLVAILHDTRNPVAPANYLDWKRQNTVFSSVGAAEYWVGNVSSEVPERVQGLRVTSDVLAMTGIRPALGRLMRPEEDESTGDRPVVLAWGYWQRRFAGSRDVLGKRLIVDGTSYTVIGVMPRGFDFPMFWARGVQMWAPLALGERASSRRGQSLRVFGRLAANTSLETARAQMTTIAANLEKAFPGTNRNVTVTPLTTLVVGDVRTALLILLGAVGFVLLIACANVAHMLLARAAARHREMTVRLALGASRARLLRQLLTESIILALIGGALGVGLARAGLDVLVALSADSIPRSDGIVLDPRVLLFTAVISFVTGIGFGLLPALRVSRSEIAEALRDGARGSTEGVQRSRTRSVLVGSEIALALMLLTGAGLAMRSFVALRAIDPGIDPHGVLSAVISLKGTAEAPPGRRETFYATTLERVRQLPGVESASLINHLPIAGDIWGYSFILEGRPRPQPGDLPTAAYRVVYPGYFRAMGLPVLRGRDVSDADHAGEPGVVIVNDFFARRYWPNDDAIGKRIAINPGEEPTWLTVVGVVKNAVRSDWSSPPSEEMFIPYRQEQQYLGSDGGHVAYMTLVVRASCATGVRCNPASLAPAIREVVGSQDRAVPLTEVQTMDDVVAGANARPRFTLVLLATFATVALMLAAVGIYGVISYAVSRRTHEIGVRMALGATPATVVRLIIGQGMRVVALGVIGGLAGALLVTRLMTSMVYGVHVTDPLTYGTVALLLGAVALFASYIPARRATKVDPLRAMRAD
jgi:putative ABC transport system permease protein